MERGNSWLMLAGILSGLVVGNGALAQEKYPSRPITVIIGFPAGGVVDVQARAASELLGKELGQPVIVVNRPGAGSTLGVNLLAKAKPDGYTIMNNGFIANVQAPYLYDVDWKPEDFTYLLGHSTYNFVFAVRPDAPWKTFEEWLDDAGKHPGFKYGTYGPLTPVHLLMEWVAKQRGLKLVHIPYVGWSPAVAAILGGHIDIYGSGGTIIPQIRGGKLRTIVQLKGQSVDAPGIRVQHIHEVFKNAPLELLDLPVGFFAPKNLPDSVTRILAAALKKATIENREFKKVNETLSVDVEYIPPEEVVKRVSAGYVSFGKLVKELDLVKGIRKETIQ